MEFYPSEFPPVTELTSPVGGDIDFADPTFDPSAVVLGDIESQPGIFNFQIGKMFLHNFLGVDVILNSLSGIGFDVSSDQIGTWPTAIEVRTTDPALNGTSAIIHYENTLGNLVSESITLSDSGPYPQTSALANSFVRLDLPLPTVVTTGILSVYRENTGGFIGFCSAGSSTVYGHIYVYEDFPPTSTDTITNRKDPGAYFTQNPGFPRTVPPEFNSLDSASPFGFVSDGEEIALWVFSLIFPGLPARPAEDMFIQWDGEEDISGSPVFALARMSFGQTANASFEGECVSRLSTTYSISGECDSRLATVTAIEGGCKSRVRTDNSISGECRSRLSTTYSIEGECKARLGTSLLATPFPGVYSPLCSPAILINGPIPTDDLVKSLTVTEQTDGGWTVAVNMSGFVNVNLLNKEDVWMIQIADQTAGTLMKLPPMVIVAQQNSTVATCSGTTINLYDQATYKASEKKVNLPTFINQSSVTILSAVASAAGVQISGATSWIVNYEDIKDVKAIDVFRRYGKAMGKDLSVSLTGEFVYSSACETGANHPSTYLPKNITVGIDWTLKKGKQNIIKTSPINEGDQTFAFDKTGQHPVSLSRPISEQSAVVDESAKGFVDLIQFWNGPVAGPGSKLLKILVYNFISSQTGLSVPVQPGAGPCTHMAFNVFNSKFSGPSEPADAAVRIIASPAIPPPGTEHEFTTSIGSGDPEETLDEPMFPSAAFVQSNKGNILCMLQKGFRTVSATGTLELNMRIKQLFSSQFEDARVEQVTHEISSSSSGFSSTSISCNIPQET